MKKLTPINICDVHSNSVYEIFKQTTYSYSLVGITLNSVFIKSQVTNLEYEFKWDGRTYGYGMYDLHIDKENRVIIK